MQALIIAISGVVHEGIKTFNEERRTRFIDQHFEILESLKNAQNAQGEDYTDAAIDVSQEDLTVFLMAYKNELENHNRER